MEETFLELFEKRAEDNKMQKRKMREIKHVFIKNILKFFAILLIYFSTLIYDPRFNSLA